ncbi:hypothetical protein M434DRAFT_37108 [Hypoxylon sp. CO27-5]|nr:hypothetical protein M434DRAFT_37108 [Hypoxylon sp. CO27-5]
MTLIKGDVPASGLSSTKSEAILNQINKIRRNGVSDAFELPQIVACGDQSSGKSSVLERLTGIPLPQGEGPCTRFPIEILIRHTDTPLSVYAEVKPHHSRPPYIQSKIKEKCHWIVGDLSELSEIVSTATRTIQSYGYAEFEAGKAFTADVLQIEVVGPTGLHITFVDLPGLITVTNYKQTKDDAGFAQQLMESYMSDSRSMILAVMSATSDINNQRALSLAQKHDPEGCRTLGVITKTDLIKLGSENQIVTVANNAGRFKLQLGYFLLRNPGPRDLAAGLDAEAYTKAETEYFSCSVWRKHQLNRNRAGMETLKKSLQSHIAGYYERRVPRVQNEIRQKMTKAEKELVELGVEQRTDSEIRSFLTGLSTQFHLVAQNACDGDYQGAGANFFSHHRNRLRTKVHDVNGGFSNHMRNYGETRKVVDSLPGNENEQYDKANPGRLLVTQRGMLEWAGRIYAETRGRELRRGSKTIFLAELFHEQSSRWPSIATGHVEYMCLMIRAWVDRAFSDMNLEANTRSYITALCNDGLVEIKKLALEELSKLIDDEGKQPMTYNHCHTDLVGKPQDETNSTVDTPEQACNKGIVFLNSYYEIAKNRFVDNVCRQVIERHLISRLPSIFCPEVVNGLSREALQKLRSEPQEKRFRRVDLKALIQGYRDSLAVLKDPQPKS